MREKFARSLNIGMSTLPIFNYHGVESRTGEYPWLDEERPYVLTLGTFEAQLDQLLAQGFQSLSSGQLGAWLAGPPEGHKSVVLTFDDGHMSHYEHVAGALERRGLKGIFFIPVGLVGERNRMNWDHMKALLSRGFEIGSHGMKHIPLTNLSHHELWKEMSQSKKILEGQLGIQVNSFSVPRGFYQLRIREVALELGYQFVFTSRFDVNQMGEDQFRLNRLAIKSNHSLGSFSKMIHGKLGPIRMIERAKEVARRFLNPSFYDSLAELKRSLSHG